MLRVIVQVKHQRSNAETDVEVPAEIPLEQLAGLLSRALGWNDCGPDESVTYVIRQTDGSAPLSSQTTLAELKLWDGASLLFEPVVQQNPTKTGRVQPATLISESGRRYSLSASIHRLGRSALAGGDDAALIDLKAEPLARTVSRHHADLRYQQLGWFIYCLPDAQNQTFCNDELLQPSQFYRLSDGDWLQLGGVRLRFHAGVAQEDDDHD
ncbi:MAG: FHA domain protein [Chloroflexi bacterium ADurb.Bin360]|nr:MAG: FHA domain protein [Chloroflexi bacterium ADurb.Bin360]